MAFAGVDGYKMENRQVYHEVANLKIAMERQGKESSDLADCLKVQKSILQDPDVKLRDRDKDILHLQGNVDLLNVSIMSLMISQAEAAKVKEDWAAREEMLLDELALEPASSGQAEQNVASLQSILDVISGDPSKSERLREVAEKVERRLRDSGRVLRA